ncbi:MAG: hypothetical protein KBT46_07385 [Ruminococcus sp.]|nr:hypothetical protein [Candidatus Copronaster equi]
MSKKKRILSSIMVIALSLCVGYYSFMPSTSAWFYESGVIDSKDSFVFGDLSVNMNFQSKANVEFDGATKLADETETLFDTVVNVNKITVTNKGTIPARIYADVINKSKVNSLHWFFYTDSQLVNGSIRETIKSLVPSLKSADINKYNVGDDGQSGKYFMLNPGESLVANIATWIEYDEVSGSLKNGEVQSGEIEIKLFATQDKDGAVKR